MTMKKILALAMAALMFFPVDMFAGFGFGLPHIVKTQVQVIDKKVADKKEQGGGTSASGATLSSIAVTPAGDSAAVGATKQFTATGAYSDGSHSAVTAQATWTSSLTSIATIGSSGLATAVSAGNTTITAAVGSVKGSTTLTVTTAAGGSAPGAFTITSPVNGDASASTTPTLSWNASSGAASYTVEVASASTFGATDVVNQTGLVTTSLAIGTPLTKGVIYYWRVTAVNSSGSTAASNAPLWFSCPIPVGTNPNYVAVTPDGTKALITNANTSGTVTVLTLSNNSTATIGVGNSPAGVAITPDGSKAVVANGVGHSISVINLVSNTVTSTYPSLTVGDTLYDIAVTTDGTTAVFGGLSSGGTQDGLDIMPIATGVITFVNFMPYNGPFGVAVTPDGASTLTTNGVTGSSIKRMAMSGHGLTTITGTSSTFGVAITPDSATALVTSGQGDTVKRVTLASNSVTATISFESNQSNHNVAITPDGTIAVVVGDYHCALISLATNAILANYPDGGANVAIAPNGKLAYITGGSGSGSSPLKVIRIKE
jgi:YVTN family beta-propeller protein